MKKRITIQKGMKAAGWLLGASLAVLLLAGAAGDRGAGRCTGYKVSIKAVDKHYFIEESDIIRLMKKATQGDLKGQSLDDFDLEQLEKILRRNTWIEDAELYFDNNQVLYIDIREKEPVARIFTDSGQSFYVDKKGNRMPLSDSRTARVPVFTGIPDFRKASKKDSMLLGDISTLASYVSGDPFWSAQAEQFTISSRHEFEMIPMVGDHVVCLGDASKLDKKFHRLFLFYKQVLRKTGFDHYSYINVAYKGQVVATRKGTTAAPVDSVQLSYNVRQLMEQAKHWQQDQ